MIDQSWYVRIPGVKEDQAAGGIVVRREGDALYVALAHEKSLDSYVLPKGHLDPGETPEQAAAREIEEEVGINDLTPVGPLGVLERLSYNKLEWKTTHYFLFTTEQVDAVPTDADSHEHMAWVPLDAVPALFWPEQQKLIDETSAKIYAHFGLTPA